MLSVEQSHYLVATLPLSTTLLCALYAALAMRDWFRTGVMVMTEQQSASRRVDLAKSLRWLPRLFTVLTWIIITYSSMSTTIICGRVIRKTAELYEILDTMERSSSLFGALPPELMENMALLRGEPWSASVLRRVRRRLKRLGRRYSFFGALWNHLTISWEKKDKSELSEELLLAKETRRKKKKKRSRKVVAVRIRIARDVMQEYDGRVRRIVAAKDLAVKNNSAKMMPRELDAVSKAWTNFSALYLDVFDDAESTSASFDLNGTRFVGLSAEAVKTLDEVTAAYVKSLHAAIDLSLHRTTWHEHIIVLVSVLVHAIICVTQSLTITALNVEVDTGQELDTGLSQINIQEVALQSYLDEIQRKYAPATEIVEILLDCDLAEFTDFADEIVSCRYFLIELDRMLKLRLDCYKLIAGTYKPSVEFFNVQDVLDEMLSIEKKISRANGDDLVVTAKLAAGPCSQISEEEAASSSSSSDQQQGSLVFARTDLYALKNIVTNVITRTRMANHHGRLEVKLLEDRDDGLVRLEMRFNTAYGLTLEDVARFRAELDRNSNLARGENNDQSFGGAMLGTRIELLSCRLLCETDNSGGYFRLEVTKPPQEIEIMDDAQNIAKNSQSSAFAMSSENSEFADSDDLKSEYTTTTTEEMPIMMMPDDDQNNLQTVHELCFSMGLKGALEVVSAFGAAPLGEDSKEEGVLPTLTSNYYLAKNLTTTTTPQRRQKLRNCGIVVVIVEDQSIIRRLVIRAIKRQVEACGGAAEKWSFEEFSTAEAAQTRLERLKDVEDVLVTVDENLHSMGGVMTGSNLIAWLRKIHFKGYIVSSTGNEDAVEAHRRAGAHAVWGKVLDNRAIRKTLLDFFANNNNIEKS